MGRRKLEMKRIEEKSSRLVTFSKRRSGLFKKARHLSLLCDAHVAVIVFSDRGKLYDFSTTTSVDHILARYERSCLEAGDITKNIADKDLVGNNVTVGHLQQELLLQCNRFRTCKELLQTVDRLAEENNDEELSVNDMLQLEQELDAALLQTRLRKTQLMMEYISSLKEKGNELCKEKEEMEKQIASAEENDVDDGGGDLNSPATNQISSPQLVTLALFKG